MRTQVFVYRYEPICKSVFKKALRLYSLYTKPKRMYIFLFYISKIPQKKGV